jgi:hypothetical protein
VIEAVRVADGDRHLPDATFLESPSVADGSREPSMRSTARSVSHVAADQVSDG